MPETDTKKTVFIVTTPKLTIQPTCSFKFMIDAVIPSLWIREAKQWGFLWLQDKGPNHLDPWEWAKKERGEPHGQIVGDDGVKQWALHVFESGKGEILGAGWNDNRPEFWTAESEFWNSVAMLSGNVILCMERDLYARVATKPDERFNIELHQFAGDLTTG